MIGAMRNRIIIQTLGGATDSGGGQATSYSTLATVWAEVINNSGQENMFGDQVRTTDSYTFTIRYLSSVTTKHRISYNSLTFNIQSIRSLFEGKEKYQIIQATEGVAT
jgi:SPP1 family predicted phage head-tail adaptor|tara:strand:+ start:1887 stop:2210 length:324 start_codon:yes stop_codon:yes gene_type:complete